MNTIHQATEARSSTSGEVRTKRGKLPWRSTRPWRTRATSASRTAGGPLSAATLHHNSYAVDINALQMVKRIATTAGHQRSIARTVLVERPGQPCSAGEGPLY